MSGQHRRRETEKAADIVRAAGGRVVGRTRLQKIGYLLELAGLGEGFPYAYRYYGPYSEERLTAAAARWKPRGPADRLRSRNQAPDTW